MTASGPFELLGLSATATRDELTEAWRRLAREHHPDRGGDVAAMQALNAAYREALQLVGRAQAVPVSEVEPAATSASRAPRRQVVRRRVQHDTPSFTIDVLPVEAYEALLIVTSWMGEVLVDDPPYVLEVFLHDPAPCWCRLDLVPDAGATTVSLTVAAVDTGDAPDIDAVRDLWVANLNQPLW